MQRLKIVKTLAEMEELREYLSQHQYIAYDTETTGVDKDSEIIGFSFCAEVDLGIYVVLSYWDSEAKELKYLETKTGVKALLECLTGKDLIMHNAGFDCWMTNNNFGIDLMPYVYTDTMLLAHLLDENRSVGLKELGVSIYGADARKEQEEMKASVHKNGGVLTKEVYELYKADVDLMANYGAKDTILTLQLFLELIPNLYEQGLEDFFFQETMPLLKGPTYDLNTTGLKVDPDKLQNLRGRLEAECLEAKAYIYHEITPHVKGKYPGTGKTNTFNIGASKQLSWLLFFELGNEFNTLTKSGRTMCKALGLKLPYSAGIKRDFIREITARKGEVWAEAAFNPKTRKMGRPKKIEDPWNYLACGKESLTKLSNKYKWVEKLLEYSKNMKLLNTYVEGIQRGMRYNIIRPNFLQHGTTSGRYSCKRPNFQNLPRDDKRVKGCIIARPGKIFVGSDYSQLEPRVFASFSKDKRLLDCFKNGDDFYSVIGMEVFEKFGCSLKKDAEGSFAKLYPDLRNVAKVIALSATYGTTAPKMAPTLKKDIDEAQDIIDSYFTKFPSVLELMLESHEMAKDNGQVTNLFGRPRRMPQAKEIRAVYGESSHGELPYEIRNILNLAINHRIQSTGASIMNRAAIACWENIRALVAVDPLWSEVKIILQVHDELILEGPEALKDDMIIVLKESMEHTVELPGVDLVAEPVAAYNLADLKG